MSIGPLKTEADLKRFLEQQLDILRPPGRQIDEIGGRVTSGGEVAAGKGFTAQKVETGVYEITLEVSLGDAPAITATAVTTFYRSCTITVSSASVFRIHTRDSVTGNYLDSAFHFDARRT